MHILFLFFTQAEAGAPGYLSRKGEEAAHNLTENLAQFAMDTLGVDFTRDYEARARSLNEDIRWKAFRHQESLPQAITASLRLFPDVLLLTGNNPRSLKTAESLAQQLALPVCVDNQVDAGPEIEKRKGNLASALSELLQHKLTQQETVPRLIFTGTSLSALKEWIQATLPQDTASEVCDALSSASQNDELPVVFICGAEIFESTEQRDEAKQVRWVFN